MIVPLSEGELIYSELVEGVNTILVNYGAYNKCVIEINVKFDTKKYNKTGFIEAVSEIEKVTGLNDKYVLIFSSFGYSWIR